MRTLYPPEPWRIVEAPFDPSLAARNETIFALANGALGMRGSFEEGFPLGVNGTYLNGFYDETPIQYGEVAYGYARNRQVMLNIADGKPLALSVDGEPFDLSTGAILSFRRTLDMRAGMVERTLRWRSPSGRLLALTSRRLVSFRRPRVAAIDWAVTLEGGRGAVVLTSSINGKVQNQASGDDPRKGSHFLRAPLTTVDSGADGLQGFLVQETRNTRLTAACAMDHAVDPSLDAAAHAHDGDPPPPRQPDLSSITLSAVHPVHVTIPRDCSPGGCAGGVRRAGGGRGQGRQASMRSSPSSVRSWTSSGDAADIEIDGDDTLQQSLRFNLFSLFQSAGRNGRTSIAAKGLTEKATRDTTSGTRKFTCFPSSPTRARPSRALSCAIAVRSWTRHGRARAEMNQKGALFPWRTIGGEETSPYYPPAQPSTTSTRTLPLPFAPTCARRRTEPC